MILHFSTIQTKDKRNPLFFYFMRFSSSKKKKQMLIRNLKWIKFCTLISETFHHRHHHHRCSFQRPLLSNKLSSQEHEIFQVKNFSIPNKFTRMNLMFSSLSSCGRRCCWCGIYSRRQNQQNQTNNNIRYSPNILRHSLDPAREFDLASQPAIQQPYPNLMFVTGNVETKITSVVIAHSYTHTSQNQGTEQIYDKIYTTYINIEIHIPLSTVGEIVAGLDVTNGGSFSSE